MRAKRFPSGSSSVNVRYASKVAGRVWEIKTTSVLQTVEGDCQDYSES